MNAKNWWRREGETEYMPSVSKESLDQYIKSNGIQAIRTVDINDKHPSIVQLIIYLRQFSAKLAPNYFIYSLFSAAILIKKF